MASVANILFQGVSDSEYCDFSDNKKFDTPHHISLSKCFEILSKTSPFSRVALQTGNFFCEKRRSMQSLFVCDSSEDSLTGHN